MDTPEIDSFVRPDSLGDTLDVVNAALFYKLPIPPEARQEAAEWIADRQGLPGSYANMFAPTGYDYTFGTLAFTGEPIRSGAATGHILGEEACQAIFRLGVHSAEIDRALARAREGIFKRLMASEPQGLEAGVYCCGTCSAALWRHLASSGKVEDERRLANGLAELNRYRDGKGRWRRFPFYYTLLALADINLPAVRDEITYALPVLERAYKRLGKEIDLDTAEIEQPAAKQSRAGEIERRRKLLIERLFDKI